jgi:hypothetical protein
MTRAVRATAAGLCALPASTRPPLQVARPCHTAVAPLRVRTCIAAQARMPDAHRIRSAKTACGNARGRQIRKIIGHHTARPKFIAMSSGFVHVGFTPKNNPAPIPHLFGARANRPLCVVAPPHPRKIAQKRCELRQDVCSERDRSGSLHFGDTSRNRKRRCARRPKIGST